MRIAIDTSTEVGNRAVRVLLSDADVEYIGVLGEDVPSRKRSGPIDSIYGFDVLISDGTTDVHRLLGRCAVENVALVLWRDESIKETKIAVPVVTGANVANALTAALTAHPTASISDDDIVTIGWTEPGKELRSGDATVFPDPIGPQWGRVRSAADASKTVVAFRDDAWAGAVVDVDGPQGRRIVGVSDHGAFMEAIVLAGVGMATGRGAYPVGVSSAASQPEPLLDMLNHLELEIATWHSTD